MLPAPVTVPPAAMPWMFPLGAGIDPPAACRLAVTGVAADSSAAAGPAKIIHTMKAAREQVNTCIFMDISVG